MNELETGKRAAARAALQELPPEGLIGLGSGSTARLFIEELAARVRSGQRYEGIPTSEAARALAISLGIPLRADDGPWQPDVTVDGADEVSDTLDLLKGGGGAHTREKIVNFAARRNVVVVDASKRSRWLGERRPVAIELLAFGRGETLRHLEAFGEVTLRLDARGPARTDAGNLLCDLATGPIHAPAALDAALRAIPGVVANGIFVQRADVVLVGNANGIERFVRA